MTTPKLQSREEFTVNGIERDTCNICHEPFHADHLPVRIESADSCNHVFGEGCLKDWLPSDQSDANKFPKCRHVVYQADEEDDDNSDKWGTQIWTSSWSTKRLIAKRKMCLHVMASRIEMTRYTC